jgi:hypothetical protein
MLLAVPLVADTLPAKWGTAAKANSSAVTAPSPEIWTEYGFVSAEAATYGKVRVTAYRMKDATGALAAWESLRPSEAKPCAVAPYCAEVPKQTLIFDDNYILLLEGTAPQKPHLDALLSQLPGRKETSLPALLTFIPRQNLVPNSARYLLGPASLKQFTPELSGVDAGFAQGAEGHLTAYKIDGGTVRLALFNYPTPEQARLHTINFKVAQGAGPGALVKRSAVLVALVLGAASEKQADDLLARVQYEAKITWNEPKGISPVKKLYTLFMSIILISCILSALAATAGLFYAAMRIYRRRYGTLEDEEAMTTLHLG